MSRPTPETDAFAASEFVDKIDELTQLYDLSEKLKRERDEAREQNAKLRDIAERAIELALAYYDGPCERDGAKLRLELDQLKEGGK